MYSYDGKVGLALEDAAWFDPTIAVAVFLFSLLLAFASYKLLFPIVLRLTNRTPTDLDSRIIQALQMPLAFGIVVLGLYLALTVPLNLSGGLQSAVNAVARVLGIGLGVMAVAGLTSNFLTWYMETVASRTPSGLDDKIFPLLRRVSVPLVCALGTLLVLDQLNINISPLIAGLGLGGLAVALAIQPTMSNLFAGTYVMTEGVIEAGDYIELENGIAGYVVDVSWRSTRLRTWGNNLVVVPNAKFAETILTNYQEPTPEVNVYLSCGVSYDSDLYHVERVCHEVMDQLLDTNPQAVKEYGGWFGYESFADSNVNFWLFLQARDRLASFEVQTDLMQRLHKRFKEDGIVINYPVRELRFPGGWRPEAFAGRNPGDPAGNQPESSEEDHGPG